MMSKKGSMELGINAIVVLIIALALLGLGIAFVTKLFSASQSKMVRIIDRTELPIHADASNKLVFDTSNIQMKQGKDEVLIASLYNDANSPTDGDVQIIANSCVQSITDASGVTTAYPYTPGNGAGISINSPAQSIDIRTDAGYSILIHADNVQASYICTLQAQWTSGGIPQSVSKQVFITVS
jgi:hypothetical protein